MNAFWQGTSKPLPRVVDLAVMFKTLWNVLVSIEYCMNYKKGIILEFGGDEAKFT